MTSTPIPAIGTPLQQQYGRDDYGTSIEWYRYWQSFANAPAAGVTLTVGASPFSYTAPSTGTVILTGGTGVSVSIIRGRDTFATGMTAGMIPTGKDDTVVVTYSVTPTMVFLPS